MWTISSLIIVILALPLRHVSWNYFNDILSIFVGLFHTVSIHSILKIKRLRFISPLIHSLPIFNIVTTFSLIVFTFLINRPNMKTTYFTRFLILLSLIIIFLLLIHWWQAQITKSYRHSVRERELESLRLEVQEKDKQLKELSKKNEQMGHLIHEDTKIIRTFISGLEDYVETDFSEESTRKAKGKELLEVVYEHADERLGTIRNISHKEYATYSTNIETLNLQLNHFSKRASIEDITFHVHIACNLEDYIPKSISTTDLSHLLSNLLDNAFLIVAFRHIYDILYSNNIHLLKTLLYAYHI